MCVRKIEWMMGAGRPPGQARRSNAARGLTGNLFGGAHPLGRTVPVGTHLKTGEVAGVVKEVRAYGLDHLNLDRPRPPTPLPPQPWWAIPLRGRRARRP